MLVQPQELKALLHDSNVRILHVGWDPKEYRKAHVPGALFVPWKAVAIKKGVPAELPSLHRRQALAHRLGIDPHTRVVIYDNEKKKPGVLAARVFFALDSIGLADHAALLNGQFSGWKEAGLPVTDAKTAKPKPSHHNGVPRRNTVTLKEVKRLVNQRGGPFQLIDARSEKEYSGEKPGKGIRRPGHMPHAVNVPFTKLLVSKQKPEFRSPEELRKLLQVGEGAEKLRWVPYCRTGAKASLTYFVLRYLGLAPRLYDGSFIQWSNGPDLKNPLCSLGPQCSLDHEPGHEHDHEKVVRED
jgi:thiosulfate/3-mercaptopyruvate sulfurtransferase